MARRATTTNKTISASTRVLVLYGPEDVLKQDRLTDLKAVLTEQGDEPAVLVFDGKAAPLADVLDEVRSYSLMGGHKIVIVEDADVFVTAHRDAMERYAAAPVDHAVLVLRASKWNKGNLDKTIEKVGAIIHCETPSPAEIRDWLVERAARVHKAKFDPRAADLLVERMSGSMSLLDGEVGKLASLSGGQPISVELVEQLVGRSSEEEAYAVQDAVLTVMFNNGSQASVRDLLGKLHEVVRLSGQPDILVMYFVADLMRKLHLATAMRESGAPEAQIGRELRLWGPRQQMFMQVARKLSVTTAERLLDRAIELDARAKTGRGEAMRNIEVFCAALSTPR